MTSFKSFIFPFLVLLLLDYLILLSLEDVELPSLGMIFVFFCPFILFSFLHFLISFEFESITSSYLSEFDMVNARNYKEMAIHLVRPNYSFNGNVLIINAFSPGHYLIAIISVVIYPHSHLFYIPPC